MKREKAVVIGSGFVGSTIAYTLAIKGIFDDIAIIDINQDKAEGDAIDISHGGAFVKPVRISSGDYKLCRDADVIIITAGVAQSQGETRLDLLHRNIAVFKSITDNIKAAIDHEPIVMVVSNPVDILTYVTWKMLGFSKNKVFGSGTVLDTSRMKYLLGKTAGVDVRNVHTYVIGEHGDSSVAAWSATSIAGLSPEQFNRKHPEVNLMGLPHQVKEAAYDVIDKKGATYYAIALAVARICEALVGDEKSVLTVSSVLEGEYGMNFIALSVPCVVGVNGVDEVIELDLSDIEAQGLRNSAEIMAKLLREAGF